jgi:hypothetical protein
MDFQGLDCDEVLATTSRELYKIEGDGHCQFAGLAQQIFGDEFRWREVRQRCLDFVHDN